MMNRLSKITHELLEDAKSRGLVAAADPNLTQVLDDADKALDAAIASLAEDIYLRVIVDPAFASWPLNRRAEYAKRAARIFHGVEE